ncbi:hypothetical protein CRYUN_Cryun02cG0094900 [Craigia yunnanensis]
MGGAAILLSNKRSDGWRSKYRLVHNVRTHKGADDKRFTCVTQKEDSTGRVGVSLSKDLMAVAGNALRTNITTLGPLVLQMSEQLLFFATLVSRKLFKIKVKPYIPDSKLAFEHFCIHAGGRAVLDESEKNFQLSDWHMESSRMTLYRFAKERIKKADRTWQIAFDSGFKCNSAVWKALRTINPAKEKNPKMDEIHQVPVDVPKVLIFGGLVDKRIVNVRDETTTIYGYFDKGMSKFFTFRSLLALPANSKTAVRLYSKMAEVKTATVVPTLPLAVSL